MEGDIQKVIEEVKDTLSHENMKSGWNITRKIGKPQKGFGPKKTMRVRNICKS
jgi:hypothetical protein